MGVDLNSSWMLVGLWLGVHFGGGLVLIWVVVKCCWGVVVVVGVCESWVFVVGWR